MFYINKTNIAIIFLVIQHLALLRNYIPYLEYLSNKKYIIQNFCKNKDEPEIICAGMCHLSKEMQKAQEDKNFVITVFEYTSFFQDEAWQAQARWRYLYDFHFPYFLVLELKGFLPKIFHPPSY
ncbi:MAG: hypothetical protein AAFU64_01825 [Bacteroidota bacterium]